MSNYIALLLLLVVLGASSIKAQGTNGLSEAEIKGRELAQKLRDAWPDGNLTNTGILQIRPKKGKRVEIPVRFETFTGESNWSARYSTCITNAINEDPNSTRTYFSQLTIVHSIGQPNLYLVPNVNPPPMETNLTLHLDRNEILGGFARSDFWYADLGLEFFHWPQQKLLPKTTTVKKSRDYFLLESTNPDPPANGYARVLSWIDKETGGIIEAYAFDAQGNKLKEFEPKSYEKVNGQWQVEEIQIYNLQTGSSTRIDFDLKK